MTKNGKELGRFLFECPPNLLIGSGWWLLELSLLLYTFSFLLNSIGNVVSTEIINDLFGMTLTSNLVLHHLLKRLIMF